MNSIKLWSFKTWDLEDLGVNLNSIKKWYARRVWLQLKQPTLSIKIVSSKKIQSKFIVHKHQSLALETAGTKWAQYKKTTAWRTTKASWTKKTCQKMKMRKIWTAANIRIMNEDEKSVRKKRTKTSVLAERVKALKWSKVEWTF